jgi:SAM-dependent methyltransferase
MFYDSYDKTANPLQDWQAKKLYHKFIKPIAKELPQNPNVLEIGYGRGSFYKVFSMLYPKANYSVIDANADICENAKKNGVAKTYCTMIPPLPKEIDKESFDLIVLNYIVEHFPNWQTVAQIFGELKNLLKSTGKIIVFVPDFLDWGADFWDNDYSHSFITTRYNINRLLIDCEYDIIKNDYFRSAFNNFRIFFWLLNKINSFVFGVILRATGQLWKRKFLSKCKIAFHGDVLVIAKKK